MCKDLLEHEKQILENIGLNPNDVDEWKKKFTTHRDNSSRRKLDTELDFKLYVTKAKEANITNPSIIGIRKEQYQLGRIGDEGPYTEQSCRFITGKQNKQEAINNGCMDNTSFLNQKGETKETSDRVSKISETLTGRTAETHQYIKDVADKRRGRTKETDDGLKAMSEKRTGRTKENHEGTANQADKLTGRTKDSHEYLVTAAIKRSKEFTVLSPDGVVYTDRNANAFCKSHNLSLTQITRMFRGERDSFKGWQGKYIDKEED
jgi:hypothetical protein